MSLGKTRSPLENTFAWQVGSLQAGFCVPLHTCLESGWFSGKVSFFVKGQE